MYFLCWKYYWIFYSFYFSHIQSLKEKIITTCCIVTQMHCNYLLYHHLGPSCIQSVDNKLDSTQHYLLSIKFVMCYLFLTVCFFTLMISLLYITNQTFYFQRARWKMAPNCNLLIGKWKCSYLIRYQCIYLQG